MESEAGAGVPPEECDSGVCVTTTAEATVKLDEQEIQGATGRQIGGASTPEIPTQESSVQQITNPAPSEPDITEPGAAAAAAREENCEPGALKGASSGLNSDVGAVSSTVEETNITLRSKLEDGIRSLASEETVSENPESLSNENEAEGKLRRQNASHRLVEGVRISSQGSKDQA